MEGRTLRILALLSTSLGLACATASRVSVDERGDFSRYRTWDWSPVAARHIDAPGCETSGWDRHLEHIVRRELQRKGFEQRQSEPDVRVAVRLDVRRVEVTVYETGAVQQLSSLHFSPSYQVQAPVARRRKYEQTRLVIRATDARRGRIVWEGVLEERFRDRFSPHMAGTITGLLARFPSPGPETVDGPPPARDRDTGRPSEFTGPPAQPMDDAPS